MEGKPSMIDGWQYEDDFAASNGLSKRQVARLRKTVDGLPYAFLGREIIIHVPTAREWLLKRLHRPNPTRGAR
jgi:hypothetical protein